VIELLKNKQSGEQFLNQILSLIYNMIQYSQCHTNVFYGLFHRDIQIMRFIMTLCDICHIENTNCILDIKILRHFKDNDQDGRLMQEVIFGDKMTVDTKGTSRIHTRTVWKQIIEVMMNGVIVCHIKNSFQLDRVMSEVVNVLITLFSLEDDFIFNYIENIIHKYNLDNDVDVKTKLIDLSKLITSSQIQDNVLTKTKILFMIKTELNAKYIQTSNLIVINSHVQNIEFLNRKV